MKKLMVMVTALGALSANLIACEGDTEYVDREVEVEVPVPDERPVAAATVSGAPFETGKDITFDAGGSSDDEGVTSYVWDVDLSDGLGMDGTGETFTMSYAEAGEYTVTLTVTDADGNTDSSAVYVDVIEAPDREAPVAEAGDNRQAALYSYITFDGSASTDNDAIASYSWDFDTADGIGEDATGESAGTSYAAEATYTVRLTVTDAAGNESFDEFQVTVGDDVDAPVVEIPDTFESEARTFISFDASSASDNVGIASYAWELTGADPLEGDSAQLTYSYDQAGTYDGSLTVTDFAGNATVENFTVTVTAAVPSSLFARPDQVEIQQIGDSVELSLRVRFPDGSTDPVETFVLNDDDADFVVVTDAGENSIDIEATANGAGAIGIEALGLEATVNVRVGGDVVVVTALEHANYPAERYYDVGSQSGVISEIDTWDTALTPVDSETSGERGYILHSGTPGVENASLLVVNTVTLEQIAFCDLGGEGAYAVAARTPTEVYVAGVGPGADDTDEATDSALVKVDPTDCTVERVFVPSADGPTNGMKRGADLDIVGETLVVTDSGLTPAYANDAPSIRLFDMTTGTQRAVKELPERCLNAGWSAVNGQQLITGCTGDYVAPGAVVVTDLITMNTLSVIELGSGSPASWTFEPFSGYVFMGSGSGPYVGIVDIFGEEVIREIGDGILLDIAPDTAFEFILGIHALNPESVIAVSFSLDRIYQFDPVAAPGLDSVQSIDRVTPDPGGRGAQLIMEQGLTRQAVTLSAQNATVAAVGADGSVPVTGAIYGAPAGGGNFSPNADATSLATVPESGYIQIDLTGVELVDGPGADFVIYENPFYASGNFNSRAIDPARVQVSPDGLSWYDYPVVENSQFPIGAFTSDVRRFVSGFVGVNAAYANPETNDIEVGSQAGGGDMFDLVNIGLSSVRAIRIVDIAGDGKSANIDAVALRNWRSN